MISLNPNRYQTFICFCFGLTGRDTSVHLNICTFLHLHINNSPVCQKKQSWAFHAIIFNKFN